MSPIPSTLLIITVVSILPALATIAGVDDVIPEGIATSEYDSLVAPVDDMEIPSRKGPLVPEMRLLGGLPDPASESVDGNGATFPFKTTHGDTADPVFNGHETVVNEKDSEPPPPPSPPALPPLLRSSSQSQDDSDADKPPSDTYVIHYKHGTGKTTRKEKSDDEHEAEIGEIEHNGSAGELKHKAAEKQKENTLKAEKLAEEKADKSEIAHEKAEKERNKKASEEKHKAEVKAEVKAKADAELKHKAEVKAKADAEEEHKAEVKAKADAAEEHRAEVKTKAENRQKARAAAEARAKDAEKQRQSDEKQKEDSQNAENPAAEKESKREIAHALVKARAENRQKARAAAEARVKDAEKQRQSDEANEKNAVKQAQDEKSDFGPERPEEKDHAHGPCTGLTQAKKNLRAYLSGEKREVGADYYVGAKAAVIYFRVKKGTRKDRAETPSNDFGVKAMLHEYINVLQQGFLTRQIAQLHQETPLKDQWKDRFVVKHYGIGAYSIPDIDLRRMYDVLSAVPDDMKLLDVPTIVVPIPVPNDDSTKGIGTHATIDTAVDELAEEMFGVKEGCKGVDLEMRPQSNTNEIVAEGQAEYFAIHALSNAVKLTRPKRLFRDGISTSILWDADIAKLNAERLKEDKRMLFKDGNDVSSDGGWTPSLLGTQVMEYMYKGVKIGDRTLPAFRPKTSFVEFSQLWMDAGKIGFADAWKKVFGITWSDFVCKLENEIKGNQDCKPDPSWDRGWKTPCTENQHFKKDYPYSLCKPVELQGSA